MVLFNYIQGWTCFIYDIFRYVVTGIWKLNNEKVVWEIFGIGSDKTKVKVHTIPYHTIPHHTIPYHTTPYHTIPYHTIPFHAIGRNVEMKRFVWK